MPLACVLKGKEDPNYIKTINFSKRGDMLFLVEGAHLLHEASPQQISKYFDSREPWEDYDICIFDRTFVWCIGVTHNGHVVVVEKNDDIVDTQ